MKPRDAPPTAAAPPDILLKQLTELIQELQRLFTKIDAEVISVIRQATPNQLNLQQECTLFTRDFQRYCQVMMMLKEPIEKKLQELQAKGSCKFDEPVLASRFQTVMVLHMVGELGMGKRLEELRAIELRKKECLIQYEQAWKGIKERFDETAQRLNLLLYMLHCLQRDGALPGNIMYSVQFPQTMKSPFGIGDVTAKLRAATTFKPPTESHEITKPVDQEKFLEELAKRRELLLQLRAAAKQEKQDGQGSKERAGP